MKRHLLEYVDTRSLYASFSRAEGVPTNNPVLFCPILSFSIIKLARQ